MKHDCCPYKNRGHRVCDGRIIHKTGLANVLFCRHESCKFNEITVLRHDGTEIKVKQPSTIEPVREEKIPVPTTASWWQRLGMFDL